jgi:sugar phosphate isomerase/epimerase
MIRATRRRTARATRGNGIRTPKPHIAYIHIKAHTESQNGEKGSHVFPDSGASKVEETLRDAFANGYDGFISIEPHMEAMRTKARKSATKKWHLTRMSNTDSA